MRKKRKCDVDQRDCSNKPAVKNLSKDKGRQSTLFNYFRSQNSNANAKRKKVISSTEAKPKVKKKNSDDRPYSPSKKSSKSPKSVASKTKAETAGEYDKNDWKLNPKYFKRAFSQMARTLWGGARPSNFDPTIDAFSSDLNWQKECHTIKHHITKQQDFYSEKFDITFWKNHVPWMNLPFSPRLNIEQCLEQIFKMDIRGYLCCPHYQWEKKSNWYQNAEYLSIYHQYLRTQGEVDAYFHVTKDNARPTGKCPFHTVIFVMNRPRSQGKKYPK